MQPSRFSLSAISIKHRLPLLIGALLLGVIVAATWASYRGVKESALAVGTQRLQTLTKQLALLLQQSNILLLGKTFNSANDPAIRAFLQSPSPATRSGASAVLKQLMPPQDLNSLQVELWNKNHELVLTMPEDAAPQSLDLEAEFKATDVEPFKTSGPMRVIKDVIVAPGTVAVKDNSGRLIGYLVWWRRASTTPAPKQLTDLLGSDAALYFGNLRGDLLTNLEQIVPKPQADLGSTSEVMHYSRDGNEVMALARPISGTPWFLAIEFPEQLLLAPAHQFLQRILLVDLVLFSIGIAAAFVLSKSITEPLQVLTEAASAIGAGDYSVIADIHQDGELGALANAFNQMVATTRDSQRELERKVQERTLQLEAAPCAMLMVNREGLVALVNAQAEQLFGYDRAELLEQSSDKLLPLRYRAAHPGHRRVFGAHPSARAMGAGRDLFGLRKDGTEIPIEIGLNPITTETGEFVLASIIDITERKRAEARFRLVVEASPSAMLMVNHGGLITLVNKQTEELFGYSRGELLDQRIEMLVPERYRAAHPGLRTDFFQTPSARAMGAGRDLFGRRKDGSEMPIEIGLNPINTDDGAFVLASIIDITERKRNEQSLRESEERLNTIIENLREGLVISDLEGQLLHWNQTGLEMFGFANLEECLLKLPEFRKILELSSLDGKVLNLEQWPLQRIINGERLSNYELRLRRIDMDWNRVFSYGGTLVNQPNGQKMAVVTFTDITESKQAEERLRRSQEQLAGIIGSAMDAVITVDDEQRIVLFNGAAERMFLFPAEDAIGQPLDRFIPERFRAGHKDHVKNFGNTHVTRRSMGTLGALYGLRADGEEFPIEASISQIESDGKKLYTVILRDVSERKRSEEALKEQARILDLAPVMIRDLNGRIVFWNTGVEKMYGWKSEEALEKISHKLLKTEFPRPLEEIKARLLADGDWEGEVIHTTKDGARLVVSSHWVLHRDERNRPKAVLVIANNITERKHAEREVRRLNEELEQRVADRTAQLQAVNKELEAFSYSVSHDLRAPLRHIDGFSQALLEDYTEKLDDVGKSYLKEVRSASQEMAQLIDDVLQLARVTRSEMRREVVNLSETVHAVADELKRREPARRVNLKIEAGLETRGDKRLLKIIFGNLLGNAWKFTAKRKGAQVTFGREQKNGESAYFIRDNGAGFDMAYVGKLFGAFQRLHTAGEFEGTGIGLATVQRIVYRHGGRVWAEGAVNEGATFYFTLPNSKETGDGQQSDSIS
ncbi:MAG TPA: hypothetical protein DC047_02820 [Blastocatellia bacterium]|nr:hypothetical protein [Blastocatellia bacterium]